MEKGLEEREKERIIREAAFQAALGDNGFADEAAYRQAKMDEKAMNAQELRIRAYDEQARSLTDRLAELAGKLEGKAPADLRALQLYRGQADWDVIAQVASAVSVPVIGITGSRI